MPLKKIFCLTVSLILLLSACSDENISPEQTATLASNNQESETVVLPSKLNNESATSYDYGTISGGDSGNHQIFINKNWTLSKEYFECYYNPQNEEGYSNENRYGIADKDGNIIIEPQFAYIAPVATDRFLVANGKKNSIDELVGSEYAVIDSTGKIIIPFSPKIEYMVDYYDGLESTYFCVFTPSRFYYIADNNGNMVYDMYFESFYVAPQKNKNHTGVCDGIVYTFDSDLNIIGVIDDTPNEGEHLCTYRDEKYVKTLCYIRGNYYYGVINKTTGKEVVPCKYEEVEVFAQNRILATETRKSEVIIEIYNLNGKLLCPQGKYTSIEIISFDSEETYISAGTASAPNPNGEKHYGNRYTWLIDKNGTKISEAYYNIYYCRYGEMAGYYIADRGDRVFYLDKNGNVAGTIGQ